MQSSYSLSTQHLINSRPNNRLHAIIANNQIWEMDYKYLQKDIPLYKRHYGISAKHFVQAMDNNWHAFSPTIRFKQP